MASIRGRSNSIKQKGLSQLVWLRSAFGMLNMYIYNRPLRDVNYWQARTFVYWEQSYAHAHTLHPGKPVWDLIDKTVMHTVHCRYLDSLKRPD